MVYHKVNILCYQLYQTGETLTGNALSRVICQPDVHCLVEYWNANIWGKNEGYIYKAVTRTFTTGESKWRMCF